MAKRMPQVIEMCNGCPYFMRDDCSCNNVDGDYHMHTIQHPGSNMVAARTVYVRRHIENKMTIPEWCPLENAEQ